MTQCNIKSRKSLCINTYGLLCSAKRKPIIYKIMGGFPVFQLTLIEKGQIIGLLYAICDPCQGLTALNAFAKF